MGFHKTNQHKWSMVVSGSPKRWDRWHIIPQLAVYTTYTDTPLIYCLLGGKKCHRSHLLGESKTTIEQMVNQPH